jgi:PPOX class probable F420-dependent enzyme
MTSIIEGRARELLDEPNFAHVATLDADGSVHGVVLWVDLEDSRVVLNTTEEADWPANVRRDPRVTLIVSNRENPCEYVEIRGRVVEDTHEGADESIDALARKYLGQGSYPFRQPGEQRVVFRISPERVRLQQAG